MPRWSRSTKDSDSRSESVKKKEAAGEQRSDNGFTQWIDSLPSSAPSSPHASTLLHFAPSRSNSLDLSQANPSGLTQLLSGRKTRLSTLLLNADAFSRSLSPARNLETKIRELREDRGIATGYLASGTLGWSEDTEDSQLAFLAPILLVPLSLTSNETGTDFELQLTGRAIINPALESAIEVIAEANRVASIPALAYFTARFDPTPAIDRVRNVLLSDERYVVKSGMYVASLAHFTPLREDVMVRPTHPIISVLYAGAAGSAGASAPADSAGPASGTAKSAGSKSAPAKSADAAKSAGSKSGTAGKSAVTPEPQPHGDRVKSVDERDPETEWLVLDADSAQQSAIDRIAAGESIIVEGAPGTGLTQTAANALAALAAHGKRVLLIAESASSLADVRSRLSDVGLGSLVLDARTANTSRTLQEALVEALRRNEGARKPEVGKLYATLRETRHKLREHVQSLHNVRARWGASPYQAMQALARLTSLNPAPATTVRLKRSVLDALASREKAVERLERAADIEAFTQKATLSPWHGAALSNRKQADDAYALARTLSKELPPLIESLNTVAAFSEISPPSGLQPWGDVLDLLVSIRASLDVFKPDIFDRPVNDLISATAPNNWRRENSVEMSSMTRSRLRRVAKDYIRPGVHIDDLHQSLVKVGRQRDAWSEIAASQRHPAVPAGLAEINLRFVKVLEDATALQQLMQGSERGSRLLSLPLTQLSEFVRELSSAKDALVNLPEQTLIVDELRALGLEEFIEDLGARHVEKSAVRDELELAWWQSALEAMISGDDFVAMSDGSSLRTLEAEFRLADATHIASGPRRVSHRIGERWKESIGSDKAGAAALKEAIRSPELSLRQYLSQAPELVASLTPAVALSPYAVQHEVPGDVRFDAVFVLDAGKTDVATVLPAIGRAKQVVLFGDPLSQTTREFSVTADGRSKQVEAVPSALAALSAQLEHIVLDHMYRNVDEDFSAWLGSQVYNERLKVLSPARALGKHPRGVSIEYVADGRGMPSAEQDAVETSAAEVARTLDLVFEHIRLRPENSLAVVSASTKHANEIERAVRERAAVEPAAAAFFARADEPFTVMSAERSPQIVRDCVIVSLGYARTPHGRALHDFGPLSESGGIQAFVNLFSRARYLMHVVTSILPEHLEPSRLNQGARQLYDLMTRLIENPEKQASNRGFDDPLVADLMGRMRAHGLIVRSDIDPQLDATAAGGTLSDDPAVLPLRPLALVSDGTKDYAALSVRERSRLRPENLERLGWRYVPLWTIEVFTDPSNLAARLAALVTASEAARTPQEQATPNSGAAPEATESALVGLAEPQDSEQELPVPGATAKSVAPEASATGAAAIDMPSPKPSAPVTRRDARGSEAVNKPRHRFGLRSEDSVIPKLAKEDEPQSWSERAGEDHDQWIKDQKPPHHG